MSALKVFKGTVHPQSLPKSMQILTEDQLKKLTLYKHSSGKTTFEDFYCRTAGVFFEKYCFPDVWTPNVISILGQVPDLIMLGLALAYVGPNLDGTSLPDHRYFWGFLFAQQWASQLDIFDGIRARRQRSGSPVGRLVDEAFDMITIMCMSIFIGYGIQPNNFVLELLFFGANIIAYSFEMRFVMFGSLVMQIGELGPVENELILGVVLASCGYLKPEFM